MGDRGRQSISFIPVTGGAVKVAASGDSHLDDMQLARDGKTMVYVQDTGSSPAEIYRASSGGGVPVALTHLNDAVLGQVQLTPMEEFWVDGARGFARAGFRRQALRLPPGPQVSRPDAHPRRPPGSMGTNLELPLEPQVFAAAGYLVVMPNPRGSTGYGQKFIDEINADWGGRAFDDVMAVTDHVVANIPYADGSRMAAAGGSYGGYMVNWILGHTQRFKALVSHAGVYDLRSMAPETEELWFPIWEFGGMPWDKPETYVQLVAQCISSRSSAPPPWSSTGRWIIRVPYGQGLQLFTALQLQKVPSKLLLYPDEGHWILKPQNSLLWYKTFIEWIDSWIKK